MHFLDFISESPKFFIFQKEANKTNLGGVFIFIYILIVISICIFYIYDFIQKDEYSFSYNIIEEIIFEQEYERRKQSLEYNPILNISFDLKNQTLKSIDQRFIIIDISNNGFKLLERNRFYQKNVNALDLLILFNCEKNCKDFDLKNLAETQFCYYLEINYIGTYLNHYNEDSPLIENVPIHSIYAFGFSNFIANNMQWQVIEYDDELGIIDKISRKKEKYYTGEISKTNSFIVEDELNPFNKLVEDEPNFKPLAKFTFHSNFDKHIKYSRHKKNIFDTIGIICSLSSTIYSIIKLIFSNIYSKNFEPYKIIEKILSSKYFEMSNILEMDNLKKADILKNPSEEIIIEEDKYIKTDDEERNEKLIGSLNSYEEKNDKEINLPKFRLIHYLLNNIYSIKKWKSNKQEIISLCEEIISKYISIDYLVFNQIKLENLLKDYSWNNKKLKDIKENEYIIKLKEKVELENNIFDKFN